MSETYFKIRVQKALKTRYGHELFFFKVHGSEFMMAGLPDIVACYRGYFIGLELKVDGKKPTPRQRYVHQRIRGAGGVCVTVWTVEEAIQAIESITKPC